MSETGHYSEERAEDRTEERVEDRTGERVEDRMEERVEDRTEERMGEQMDESGSARRVFSRIGFLYLGGAILVNVLQSLITAALTAWKPAWAEDPGICLILGMIPLYLIAMPLMALAMKRLPGKVPERHSMGAGRFLLAFAMCYALTYCLNLITTFLTMIIGLLKGSAVSNNIVELVMNGNFWVNAVIMVLFAPVLEELIFRKLIVDRTLRYGEGVAILTSGIMFGLFHGNLNQVLYAAAMGMFMAFLYVRTGDIRVTIGIHMILNFFGSVVVGWLLQRMDCNELMELTSDGGLSEAAFAEYMTGHMGAWLLFTLYVLFLIAVVITGIVLFVVFRRRFRVQAVAESVPRGRRVRAFLLNPGMISYGVFWLAVILLQLFL